MRWLDGIAVAGPLDRGLEFGDGLFETIALLDGRARLLERHLARLAAGARRLSITPPPASIVAAEVARAAATPGAGLVKLILTRGDGGLGYAPAAGEAHRHLLALPARPRPPAWGEEGVLARLCTTRLAEQPLLAGLKHLNRLEQVLARGEWTDPAIAEGLMLDVQGRLICGTMTNVFMVLGEELVTPALNRAGVRGVMRGALIEAFRAEGVRVTERDVDPAELALAREVFLTNALIGAWPVRALAALAWPAGPFARRAQAWVGAW